MGAPVAPSRVVVIGAGPAGLSAAYLLAGAGLYVELHEASPFVGGLCRTIDLWGQRVDLGPHRFFSADRRVLDLWHRAVGDDYRVVRRTTRIYYEGRFFTYPLEPWNVLAGLGPARATLCLLSYLRASMRATRHAHETFEDWITARFGRRLYETFFKSYSEKLWGITGDQLDADFAAQRIKAFDLWQAVKAALRPSRAPGHRTLLQEFVYPVGGTGRVYERLARMFTDCGGRLFLNSPVVRVVGDGSAVRGVQLADGRRIPADTVVSTMPLTQLVERLDGCSEHVRAAAAQLTFRNTILCYLEVDGSAHFPDNWLYVHSPALRSGRITNFRNWTPDYRRGYQAHVQVVADHLRQVDGLQAIGRYGSFKYNNQDHSLLMGILAAESVTAGKTRRGGDGRRQPDTWAVNTEHEYQEAAASALAE